MRTETATIIYSIHLYDTNGVLQSKSEPLPQYEMEQTLLKWKRDLGNHSYKRLKLFNLITNEYQDKPM